jgi:hypothetical protein
MNERLRAILGLRAHELTRDDLGEIEDAINRKANSSKSVGEILGFAPEPELPGYHHAITDHGHQPEIADPDAQIDVPGLAASETEG